MHGKLFLSIDRMSAAIFFMSSHTKYGFLKGVNTFPLMWERYFNDVRMFYGEK
jgi:hypothetical protein